MNKHLLLLLALLGCVCPAYAQTPAVPKIVSNGFDAYKQSGAASAVDAWFTGSPLANAPTNKTNYVAFITGQETTNGKFLGYESVGTVTMSPSIKYCYVVFLYEKGFFYNWFEVYTTGGTDIITSYSSNTTASAILPASFFTKDKTKTTAKTTP
jgi:hypothetical protein